MENNFKAWKAENNTGWGKYPNQSCFSDFVFKIRLIKLGFSFQKQKFLYLKPWPTDSQSGSHNHCTKKADCEREEQKSFQ